MLDRAQRQIQRSLVRHTLTAAQAPVKFRDAILKLARGLDSPEQLQRLRRKPCHLVRLRTGTATKRRFAELLPAFNSQFQHSGRTEFHLRPIESCKRTGL